jgi:lysozyme family protein
MATQNYNQSLDMLLQHEGGYTNHPDDPGGPTNFGITIYDYRKYVNPQADAADVKHMDIEEAKKIYRARYWDSQKCDELPSGVDYAIFDYGVNSGIGRSAKVLQRLVGADADGKIGPNTLKAVQDYVDRKGAGALVQAICDERLDFLHNLRTWPVFGKGWGRRVYEVEQIALEWANAEPPAVA